jgi:hypothetical protein
VGRSRWYMFQMYANLDTPSPLDLHDYNGGDLEDGDIVSVCKSVPIDYHCATMSNPGGTPGIPLKMASAYPNNNPSDDFKFEIVTLDCSNCVVDLNNGAKIAFVSVATGDVWTGSSCGEGLVNVTASSIGTCERFEIEEW